MKLNRLELLEPAEDFEYDTIQIIRKVTCSSSCYKDLNTQHDNAIFRHEPYSVRSGNFV